MAIISRKYLRMNEHLVIGAGYSCAGRCGNMREQYAMELKQLAKMQKMWALRKPILDAHISAIQGKLKYCRFIMVRPKGLDPRR